jgi:hypothetical protein
VIEGPDFVWLHLPRCFGAATDRVLRAHWGADTRFLFDRTDAAYAARHDTLGERHARDPGFMLAGRRVICNIRRLPAWVLASGAKNPSGAFDPAASGVALRPDDVLRRYAAPRVDSWIRVEHLSRDIARVFGIAGPDAPSPRGHTTAKTSAAATSTAALRFTADELATLYAANPRWAELELRLYGALVEAAPVQKVA